jgi:hypothetical protein
MVKTTKIWGLSALVALTSFACSSGSDEEPTRDSRLTLSLLPSTSFTRAINESEFTNVNNYTVVLQGADSVWTYLYKDMPLNMSIQPGDYQLTAYYGHNALAGLDSLYMEGSTQFSVRSGETKTVDLTCLPGNAKIAVNTSSDFATYFTDYQIAVTTSLTSDTLHYAKQDVETDRKDAYVRADKAGTEVSVIFSLTPAADVTVSQALQTFTYTVKPQDCLTFTLKPDVTTVVSGTVSGVTITIDDSVNTQDVNITLPSDWLD